MFVVVKETAPLDHSFDADALFARDFLIYKLAVKPSTVKHERARKGCFVTQEVGKGERICYNYRTILHIQSEVPYSGKFLRKGLMSVTNHDFQTWSIRLVQKTKCSGDQFFNICLVPTKSSLMRFINVPSSSPDENDNISDFVPVSRSSNKIFQEAYPSATILDSTRLKYLKRETSRDAKSCLYTVVQISNLNKHAPSPLFCDSARAINSTLFTFLPVAFILVLFPYSTTLSSHSLVLKHL